MEELATFSMGQLEDKLNQLKDGLGCSYVNVSTFSTLNLRLGFSDFNNKLDYQMEVRNKVVKFLGLPTDCSTKTYKGSLIIEVPEKKLVVEIIKY